MGGIVSTTLPEGYSNLPLSSQQELTAKFQVLLNEGKSESEAIDLLYLQASSSSTTREGIEDVEGGVNPAAGVDEYIPLTDLVTCIERAVAKGKTPLIIDHSEDALVDTFFSYQSCILINAKKMGLDKSLRKMSVAEIMEGVRGQLVSALRYGYPVIVTLGNGVCDFNTTFSDEVYAGSDSNNISESQLLDLEGGKQAYFPLSVFLKAGKGLLEETVMEQLFRAEEKTANVASCRNQDNFYVAVTTRFSPEDFEEYLFGNEWGLPRPKEMFHCIAIQYGDDVKLLT